MFTLSFHAFYLYNQCHIYGFVHIISREIFFTWPSYRSSSIFLTIMRWSASSSLIHSIRTCNSSLTKGSLNDWGWIIARCSFSPILKRRHSFGIRQIYFMLGGFFVTHVGHNLLVEFQVHSVIQANQWHVYPLPGRLVLRIKKKQLKIPNFLSIYTITWKYFLLK